MTSAEKYSYWALLADYDIETAHVLIEGKRWVYVAYMCHQCLERQLKGMLVYYSDKEPPKTHNLAFLFDKLRKLPHFPENGGLTEESGNALEDFFTEITFYYVSDYPFSYKHLTNRFIDEDTGRRLYREVSRCLTMLRSLQALPEKPEL